MSTDCFMFAFYDESQLAALLASSRSVPSHSIGVSAVVRNR